MHARPEEHHHEPRAHPAYAFRAWSEISERLKAAEPRVLLLDFDGTLVRLRRNPLDAKLSERAKKILQRLACTPKVTVAIVSGRSARVVQKLVGVEEVDYFGLHGSEQPGAEPKVSGEELRALHSAKKTVRKRLREFAGVGMEDKGLGFTVHYRGAGDAAVRGANQALLATVAPLRHALDIHNGKKVWEVLPRQIAGKGSAVRKMMEQFPDTARVMYIGDDEPDEKAFATLHEHITIRVGRFEQTHAHFYLRNPSEVLRFLNRLSKELA
jgi:trehalose-phosphatase